MQKSWALEILENRKTEVSKYEKQYETMQFKNDEQKNEYEKLLNGLKEDIKRLEKVVNSPFML